MGVKYSFNPFTGTLDQILNLESPLQFKGDITVNTDFPLVADVATGWFYIISANVTDNAGATYTNTGQSFLQGDEIAWNGTNWSIVGRGEFAYSTKTNDYTITDNDHVIGIDATSNTVTITLPTAVGRVGKSFEVKAINITYAATVDTTGAETIDGNDEVTFTNVNDAITVCSDGSDWIII